jgi:hypothetical protein
MNLRLPLLAFSMLTLIMFTTAGPALCQRTLYLGLCQELVNTARSYEARANFHHQVSKNLMLQIENQAKLPKNPATIATMDNLFAQYDENRALERKYRELYRKATREADQCMKAAE